MKICRKCGVELIPGENWYLCSSKKHAYTCKECSKQHATQRNRQRGAKPRRDVIIRKSGKKCCFKCKTWKNESEFGKNKQAKDGLHCWCKECVKDCGRGHYQSLAGKYRVYERGAKRRNLTFELSLFDFASIIVQPCYYCGKKDSIYTGVDRLDSSKGYTKDNCAPCCAHCNMQKRIYSEKEFKEDTNRRFLHTLLKPFKELKKPLEIWRVLQIE